MTSMLRNRKTTGKKLSFVILTALRVKNFKYSELKVVVFCELIEGKKLKTIVLELYVNIIIFETGRPIL